MSSLSLEMHTTCTNYNNLFQKRANDFNNHTCTVYTNVKYNHTCTKEINLTLSKRFPDISKFKKIYYVSPSPLWGCIQHVQIITT